MSGFFLPERQVRDFATWFYKLKNTYFKDELALSKKHPATWEKKGNEIFTAGHTYRTKRLGYSLINTIQRFGGKIFYHGVEKHDTPEDHNPVGLYYVVLQHAIRSLERWFANKGQNFLVIIDEHPSRLPLLESAIKTMFASEYPAKHLIEPPYQVESHLYQTIQAADWISALVGPLMTYRTLPVQFSDRVWAEKFFGKRIMEGSTHSVFMPRPAPKQKSMLGRLLPRT